MTKLIKNGNVWGIRKRVPQDIVRTFARTRNGRVPESVVAEMNARLQSDVSLNMSVTDKEGTASQETHLDRLEDTSLTLACVGGVRPWRQQFAVVP